MVVGKTRLPEFAVGAVTPETRNPWGNDRIAGGSSGGSAAAVAAGECFAALSTDSGGSIRIPSALYGVVGLAPRRQTPLEGVIPVSPRLDTCGPIARTVADVTTVWKIMARQDRAERSDALRVGRVVPEVLGDVDPDILRAVDTAIESLAARGNTHRVDVRPPNFDDWHPARRVPLLADAAHVHRSRGRYPRQRDAYTGRLRAFLDQGARLSTREVDDAAELLGKLTARFMACFQTCDVIALPTVPVVAPRFDALRDDGRTPDQPAIDRTLTRLCAPVNFGPVAALTLPCGLSRQGLPIGLQLIARDEQTLLDCAHRVETLLAAA